MVDAQQNVQKGAIPLVVSFEANEGTGHLRGGGHDLAELV
jgi:hypothetical protein